MVGSAATLPMAAILLARMTVAPNLWWLCGDSGAINPTFDRLPETAAHSRNMVGAEARNAMMDVLEMGLRADWGFGFQGGMQMDKHGNANMIGIGPYDHLKVRGPGAVGTPWGISIENVYLFFLASQPESLCRESGLYHRSRIPAGRRFEMEGGKTTGKGTRLRLYADLRHGF